MKLKNSAILGPFGNGCRVCISLRLGENLGEILGLFGNLTALHRLEALRHVLIQGYNVGIKKVGIRTFPEFLISIPHFQHFRTQSWSETSNRRTELVAVAIRRSFSHIISYNPYAN